MTRLEKYKIILLCVFFSATVQGLAEKTFCFRIYLNTKGISTYNIIDPEQFLSPDAIERRFLHEIPMDEMDFPIAESLINELQEIGFEPVIQSKWLKTIVVETKDSAKVEELKNVAFVDSVQCVWRGENRTEIKPCEEDTLRFFSQDKNLEIEYGYADNQIRMLNGPQLHAKGYKGKNMRIAVIDAGFMNVNRIEAFVELHLLGIHNVTFPNRSLYCDDEHGTKSLSCMAANLPGVMIGTAPDADYLLIKSEDTRGEFPIEEDFWIAAVEYADSFGIDVISSSLGYYKFDGMDSLYTQSDLDGKTAVTSRAAEIAAKKGILIVSSAGNEGFNDWGKITFPSDAEHILTVGAITADKQKSSFSSVGLTADFRIKPDVVALGSNINVISSAGQIQSTNGTSFSAPTVAGLAACLWQAFPLLKNTDIIALIQNSASQSQMPDAQLGYGIPDFIKAYNTARNNELQKF